VLNGARPDRDQNAHGGTAYRVSRGATNHAAHRAMSERTGSTVTEVPGSHAIYVSQPAAVASLIKEAAEGA
jgi:hypothetical protein